AAGQPAEADGPDETVGGDAVLRARRALRRRYAAGFQLSQPRRRHRARHRLRRRGAGRPARGGKGTGPPRTSRTGCGAARAGSPAMSILELRKATKEFRGVPAIKDIDFTLEKGEIHAILGENVAG